MIKSEFLSQSLVSKYGIDLSTETDNTEEGRKIIFRPVGIEPARSFSIEVTIGWRSLQAKFSLGSYASLLVNAMQNAAPDQQAVFVTFSQLAINKGATIYMQVGDNKLDPTDPKSWPKKWSAIEIAMRKDALLFDTADDKENEVILPWISIFFGISFSLLPLERVDKDEKDAFGEEEGGTYEARVKKYERSYINRAVCIEIHGLRCKVCDFSFEEQYADIGKGFIHVHHMVPLSMMKEAYIINPADDLVPVCPNCHYMLHKRYPPYSIEEMKQIILESE